MSKNTVAAFMIGILSWNVLVFATMDANPAQPGGTATPVLDACDANEELKLLLSEWVEEENKKVRELGEKYREDIRKQVDEAKKSISQLGEAEREEIRKNSNDVADRAFSALNLILMLCIGVGGLLLIIIPTFMGYTIHQMNGLNAKIGKMDSGRIEAIEERLLGVAEKAELSQMRLDILYGNQNDRWRAVGKAAQTRNPLVVPLLAMCIRDHTDAGVCADALYGLARHGNVAENAIVEYEIVETIVGLSQSEDMNLADEAIRCMSSVAPELPAFRERLDEFDGQTEAGHALEACEET